MIVEVCRIMELIQMYVGSRVHQFTLNGMRSTTRFICQVTGPRLSFP